MKPQIQTLNPIIVALDKVHSSCIAALGYDQPTKTAVVQFVSGGLYTYANVPANTMTLWKKNRSMGSYFHRNIRGQYEFKRIDAKG